jgi:MoaA/NifB/PqqE/SkfB family radical SAM enzyme
MLRAMQWMQVVSRVTQLGKAHGLTEAELGRALHRLILATTAYAASLDGASPNADRFLSGLRKNLDDHPMIVVWVLRLAAQLGETPWQRFFENFVERAVVDRRPVLERLTRKLGHPPPVTLVVNPTMQCNLRCEGCYAFEFSRTQRMEPELFRKIMREARELGVRFITLTGGEPFAHPQLLDLVAEFPDLVFMSYTNGTLIHDDVADRLAELGNLLPAFSVEGFEEHTDARRGKGVHRKIVAAMERLKERGVLFGISATPTRHNVDLLCSDAFLDAYIARGAGFVWMFSYIPVGRDPDLDLMPTPAQRNQVRQTTNHWRLTRPVFVGDFWNDGPTCGGCLSASRHAFIAPDGKVQPCTFVHFYTHDLQTSSLAEVFESPFFRGIRSAQPYHENLLRPCKIIDHPTVLRRLVAEHGAKPSYPGAERIIEDPTFRDRLDAYAQSYGEIADEAWRGPDYESGRRALVPFSGFVDMKQRFPDRMDKMRRSCCHDAETCVEENDSGEPDLPCSCCEAHLLSRP